MSLFQKKVQNTKEQPIGVSSLCNENIYIFNDYLTLHVELNFHFSDFSPIVFEEGSQIILGKVQFIVT